MTQAQRVEQLLRRRGEHGVTVADFLPPEVVDGGGPITRLGARVGELRGRGLNVVREGKREGFAVYVLRDRQRVAVDPVALPRPAVSVQLIPDAPRSPLDPWEDS